MSVVNPNLLCDIFLVDSTIVVMGISGKQLTTELTGCFKDFLSVFIGIFSNLTVLRTADREYLQGYLHTSKVFIVHSSNCDLIK
jgi:hypothetical protein